MIVAVGVDTVAVERIGGLWQRAGDRFLARVFTAGEREHCLQASRPAESLAARFAAKEAVLKCLGTGWAAGIGFTHVEVVRRPGGAVNVRLHGPAAVRARDLGIRAVHLSLTHAAGLATAFAVAED